jgi:uncharacterized membrane protein YeaQ/YmgE (transglycosylase-associated protein family)
VTAGGTRARDRGHSGEYDPDLASPLVKARADRCQGKVPVLSTSKTVRREKMGILAWIVLGLIAGIVAKLIMPGRDPGGIIVTILLGIAGAITGGFISSRIGYGSVTGIDLRSVAIAVLGAIILLIVYRLLKRA